MSGDRSALDPRSRTRRVFAITGHSRGRAPEKKTFSAVLFLLLCFHQNRWDSKTRPEGKQNQSSFYIRLHHKMTIMSHTIIGEMRNPPIIFGKSNKSNRITGKGLEKAEEQNLGSLPTIPAMPLAPATLTQQHIVLQEIFLQVSYDGRERPQEVNADSHRMYRLLRWFFCTSKNRNNTA